VKRVEVKWLDAITTSGWYDKEEAIKIDSVIGTSLGYLVHKDRDKVVIAQSAGNDSVGYIFTLPKCCVLSITELVPTPQLSLKEDGDN